MANVLLETSTSIPFLLHYAMMAKKILLHIRLEPILVCKSGLILTGSDLRIPVRLPTFCNDSMHFEDSLAKVKVLSQQKLNIVKQFRECFNPHIILNSLTKHLRKSQLM